MSFQTFSSFLLELKTSDFYSAKVSNIFSRSKENPYYDFKNKKFKDDIYINYANRESTLPSKHPNHNDAIAVYAYPIQFIADSKDFKRYAQDKKLIKILKATPTKLLDFDSMAFKNENEAYEFLKKSFASSPDVAEGFKNPPASKKKRKGAGLYTIKSNILYALQHDLNGKLLSNAAQTNVFIKNGYDALKETKDELFASEEPQVQFFKTSAFSVLEVLNNSQLLHSLEIDEFTPEDTKQFYKKIISNVADALGVKPVKVGFNKHDQFAAIFSNDYMLKLKLQADEIEEEEDEESTIMTKELLTALYCAHRGLPVIKKFSSSVGLDKIANHVKKIVDADKDEEDIYYDRPDLIQEFDEYENF